MSTKVSQNVSHSAKTQDSGSGKRSREGDEGPLKFEKGQIIGKHWTFESKVNEGGFGAIYEVKHVKKSGRFAMKLSLTAKKDMDKLMIIEVSVLRKLSGQSIYFPKYEDTGHVKGYRFVVMELLGPSLSDLQDSMPGEKFSLSTIVRVGIQMLNAIEAMHGMYFIHRDIKPGNVAIGVKNKTQVYLFDFGLARRFVELDEKAGKIRVRPPRTNAPFRGTYHYCSVQQHDYQDSCRRDDLWAMMYTLIEFRTRILPWEHEKEKKSIAECKRKTPFPVLLQGCPVLFEHILRYLDRLKYHHRPCYDFIRKAFKKILTVRRMDPHDPYDWEINQKPKPRRDKHRVSLKAVFDGAYTTTNATKMSIGSESSSEASLAETKDEEIEGDLIPSHKKEDEDPSKEYTEPDPRHKK
ncbi:unnamed protein product [Bursaphelenchus xylophilus]|uniref:(pine wood nematode) hypothetical protein n=1 Tax=Bursaphelenchus xylophilus TaxID=6326 RepID=A0A1I7SEA7_BURXY|nr:unnamed protein product [Bursaphelenchus xylophilus]CAG9087397.1 unnamed protein product [Bursaphelenchus xylophilus]